MTVLVCLNAFRAEGLNEVRFPDFDFLENKW